MYAWIWRIIPFRRWQLKAAFSLLLAVAAAAVFWYQVFPAVEPILPFDDGQLQETNGDPFGGTDQPSPTGEPAGPDVIPYPTVQNNPSPRSSR